MEFKIILKFIQAQLLENQGNNFLINVSHQHYLSYHQNIDHKVIFRSFQIQNEASFIYELILKFGIKGILRQTLIEPCQYFQIDRES